MSGVSDKKTSAQTSTSSFLSQKKGDEGYQAIVQGILGDFTNLKHKRAKPTNPNKPVLGSEEYIKTKRENHRNVERRRRDMINDGINQLSRIVPNCPKNKGNIIQRTIEYINHLKNIESSLNEKQVLDNLIMNQAIGKLSALNETLSRENEILKTRLRELGNSVNEDK